MENLEIKDELNDISNNIENNDLGSNQNKRIIQKVFAIFTLVVSVIYFGLSFLNIYYSSRNIFFVLTTLIALSLIPVSAILIAFTFKNKKIMPFLIATLSISSFLFLSIFIRYMFFVSVATPIGLSVISWLYNTNIFEIGVLAILLVWAQPLAFSLFIAPITLGIISICKECKIAKSNLK